MSPMISLSDDTLAKLHSVAKPFVETTPEDVILRLVMKELSGNDAGGTVVGSIQPSSADELVVNPFSPPSLTHSKLLQAQLDGVPMTRPKWNSLLRELHVIAFKKLGSFDRVQRISSANILNGERTDAGYHPIAETGFSVQGIEANLAWEHALGLAQALGVSLDITFEWRNKDGAAHPGRRARMTWSPSVSEQA